MLHVSANRPLKHVTERLKRVTERLQNGFEM
jgi:hypothetical protein